MIQGQQSLLTNNTDNEHPKIGWSEYILLYFLYYWEHHQMKPIHTNTITENIIKWNSFTVQQTPFKFIFRVVNLIYLVTKQVYKQSLDSTVLGKDVLIIIKIFTILKLNLACGWSFGLMCIVQGWPHSDVYWICSNYWNSCSNLCGKYGRRHSLSSD